jgi:predicted chitinase/lysophospholipase L1-like esterase
MLRTVDPRIGSLYAYAPQVQPPFGFVEAPPLEMVLAGLALLELGQAGAMIAVLQQLLNGAGAELEPDGLFDDETHGCVQDFQRGSGCHPSGSVDAELLLELLARGSDARRSAPPIAPRFGAPPPAGATPAWRYQQDDEARRANDRAGARPRPAAPVDRASAPSSGSPAQGLGQRVLLLGDSHTVGEYGRSLESRLEADGRTVHRHAMVGASATTHVAGVGDQIRQSNPDSIVITLGGNFRGASQAQIRNQIDRLLGAIQESGSQANITWVGPPQRRADREDGGAELRRFDSMMATELERAAERRGMTARYVSSAPLTQYDGPDGIHYNRGAARAWSDRVHDAISGPSTPAPAAIDPAPSERSGPSDVTVDELRRIAPNLTRERAEEIVPHLNSAMREAGITTERQRAAFIAQLSAESGGFRWFEELASGDAYEGRRGLGNTEPGDGRRYKGRGPIQLTGRANYRAAGRALGLDLENNPELVATPEVGFRVAAWFWRSRGLNEIAERGDFREVTRRINGGYNGLAARTAYYDRALGVLA